MYLLTTLSVVILGLSVLGVLAVAVTLIPFRRSNH
jgi:hypothetical protein